MPEKFCLISIRTEPLKPIHNFLNVSNYFLCLNIIPVFCMYVIPFFNHPLNIYLLFSYLGCYEL